MSTFTRVLFSALGLVFALHASAYAGPRTVKVLSFNAWALPEPFSTNLKARVTGLCKVLKKSKKWDVVFLQEVWRDADQKTFAAKCGYKYTVKPLGDNDLGLLILSKHKIVTTAFLRYTKTAEEKTHTFDFDGEILVSKGAIIVEVAVPNSKSIWFANTHFVSQYPDKKPAYDYEKTRQGQFNELVAEIKKLKIPTDRLVWGGDLNIAPTGFFHEQLWDDLPKLIQKEWGVEPLQAAFDPVKDCTSCPEGRLDHLFGSKDVRPVSGKVVLKGTKLSDHFGLESEFEY